MPDTSDQGTRGEVNAPLTPVAWKTPRMNRFLGKAARRLGSRDPAGLVGRDAGPVSTRNSSKGTLLPEAHAVFRALASGQSPDELRVACLTGKLIRQPARESRRRIWQSLDWRYFIWSPPRWVHADLAESSRLDVTDRRFIGLAYLH